MTRPVPRPVGVSEMAQPAALELSFCPHDRSVHHIRLMVQNFAMLATTDQAWSSRITVTAAELAENVARHFGATSCTLKVELQPFTQSARVELSVDANERHAQQTMAWVEAAGRGSAVEAYTQALTTQDPDQEALLGLARIRYEGQMELSLRRMGSRTTVEARCGLASAATAGAATNSRVEAASRYRAPAAPWAEMRASATTGSDRS